MPKVSVIIPVFGVEHYIERCARSLFEQTLDDMEFIFVDDCTTDNSIHILENIIEQYPLRKKQTIILRHIQNKGLSHARETGIKKAKGDYIAHCDSDDWVESNMYDTMYNFAINNGYDYVKCAHRKTAGIDDGVIYHASVSSDMSKEHVISLMFQMKGWNSVWDSIAKREIYQKANLVFTDNAMFEDFFITSQLLLHAEKIGYLNIPFYNYYVNADSICNRPSVEFYVKRARQAKDNVDWIISNIRSKMNVSQVDITTIKWGVKNILIPIMDERENKQFWNEIYPEIKYRVCVLNTISWRNKLRFYSAEYNFYKYFKR